MGRYVRLVIILVLTMILLLSSLTPVVSQTVSAINIGGNPSYGIYYDGKMYVVLQGASKLAVVQDNSVVSTYNLPSYSGAVPFRIAAGGGLLYVVYQKGPVIRLTPNGQEVGVVNISHIGKYPAVCYADGYLIVTASYGNTVWFIKNLSTEKVNVMPGPQALAYDNYTNVVYVGAYQSNLIYGISLSNFKIVDNFTINDTTVDAMAFVPPDILAIATYEQQVEFVNLTDHKIIGVATFISGGINGYSQMIYDPADHYVVLSLAHNGDEVAFINYSGDVKYLITVGQSPNGVVYDPQNHYVYVMDYGSNQVSYFPSLGVTPSSVNTGVSFTFYYIIIGVVVAILVVIGVVLWLRSRN
ncbi:hypothetical protein BFU36_11850 [Sulfolobus sp. A20]|uniref:hypothetical protein n=1 Tax=Sulfolobaceae TaxID=118883 RepID=UPI000846259A|nr:MULTISPECIES: hypothetical protein [unclassified Sulfolobus]TRM74130.1 hypothetical protein DJ532_13580 [Sulfolobus sp. A20-N-F8]TRM76100.1 hypothetical protein DJ523_01745 [Sulfolobus sp. E5]TRM80574.1 hypothetical protein DJ524_07155 [Sulfolobus sp. D5]TRM83325.1 hypothetical protein DJ531_05995 [Sulfolobus sp. A20-N-F6]TRM87062.1 hypothetical protein DJ521_04310 [Sulfolobus sp. E3]TRM87435.1 hypothetical protein DJ529_08485 [Sulfolobus sp. C3]TRM93414.1 hypothetical protein DJ526_04000